MFLKIASTEGPSQSVVVPLLGRTIPLVRTLPVCSLVNSANPQ